MKKVARADGAVKKAVGFDTLPTVFDLIAGRAEGRTVADQTTCFLNNTGTGYQFAACGAVAYRKAKKMGLGNEVPTDWFTEDVHP